MKSLLLLLCAASLLELICRGACSDAFIFRSLICSVGRLVGRSVASSFVVRSSPGIAAGVLSGRFSRDELPAIPPAIPPSLDRCVFVLLHTWCARAYPQDCCRVFWARAGMPGFCTHAPSRLRSCRVVRKQPLVVFATLDPTPISISIEGLPLATASLLTICIFTGCWRWPRLPYRIQTAPVSGWPLVY